jgi:hypothetical protein
MASFTMYKDEPQIFPVLVAYFSKDNDILTITFHSHPPHFFLGITPFHINDGPLTT